MSYKEKPILKLYKYENNSFIMQAQIDDYQECSFEDNLYEAGQFSITINFNIPNAQLFQRGLFIQFGNSWKFGEISKIEDQIGENGKGSQFRIITGYDARYILKRRVIKNMNSNGLWVMTGKGEIVLRNLINDQAGTNAEEKRKLPITNTIPNSENAIGKEYSASEQFSNLYEVCRTIATQSEIGWRLEFNGTNLNLVCFNGTDRTQTVQFSTSFDSLADGKFTDSSESFANAIYVGGKGQNDDRDIYEGESAIEESSPSGLDRFECWDNQSSMTTESEYETEALSMLNQYGQTLTMSGNGLAKCPYEYEKEYFVGDKIKIAFSGKSANAQILSVTEHWAWGSYDIQFSFGKPLPDLNAQLQLILKQIQKASNKTNSTDSVRWYTIPTDTEMPKADVTYNTIGFIGNCAEGGSTFKLYLDNEKTGSKTYHVWLKQLGGGKLTLTTEKQGATNLVLDSGTYVAIISVDEAGNIVNVASTPTDVISSGNNQPVTSDAVANYTPSHATNSDYATNAGSATNADYATNAGHATSADSSTNASHADNATWAQNKSFAGQTIDCSSLDQNTWYPCILPIVSNVVTQIYSHTALDGRSHPSWATHAGGFTSILHIEANGGGWDTTSAREIVYIDDQRFYSGEAPVGYSFSSPSNWFIFYLRGGGVYNLSTDNGQLFTLYPNGITDNSGAVFNPTASRPVLVTRAYMTADLNGKSAEAHQADSATNADKVDGYHASENADASTVGARDVNGFFNAVIFHDSWDEENINSFSNSKLMFKGNNDGYLRNTDPSNVKVGNSSHADNSDLLQGLPASDFMLSSAIKTIEVAENGNSVTTTKLGLFFYGAGTSFIIKIVGANATVEPTNSYWSDPAPGVNKTMWGIYI